MNLPRRPNRDLPHARIESAPVMDVIKSADRVLDILELLASTGGHLTHAEIARRTGIPKSSLTGLLRNLLRRGYVDTGEGTSAVRLGDGAFELVRRGDGTRELVRVALPHMEALTRATGESSGLSILNGDTAERVANVESEKARFYAMHVGVRAPLYAHSGGKVFLAWMSAAEREAYLARTPLKPLTGQTILSAAVLRKQLARVRSDGFACSMSEFTPGIVGVAVPVKDVLRKVFCAVGVALPSERFGDGPSRRIVQALALCASAIERDGAALRRAI